MRVGVVVTGVLSPTSGGGFTFQDEILNSLRRYEGGHEFLLITDQKGPRPVPKWLSFLPGRTAQKIWKGFMSRFASGPSQTLLEQAIAVQNLDLVWFLSPTAPTGMTVPYIVTVWDLQHRLQPYFPEVSVFGWDWTKREFDYRATLPRATLVITGTNIGKEEVVRFFSVDSNNVRVIPMPVSTALEKLGEHLSNAKTYDLSRPYLFFPAQFWPHKNHVNLLRALDIITNNFGVDVDLVLTGADKGNLSYVRGVARELGLEERVKILGFVSREEIAALYRRAVALVFPSYFGPDNIPPLEAFLLGCPVIASDVDGAREQLGDAALFFPPSDPYAAAEAIVKLINSPDIREKLIERGKIIARERSPDQYIFNICEFLDEFAKIRQTWGAHYVPSYESILYPPQPLQH